jgi:hypothetical protein
MHDLDSHQHARLFGCLHAFLDDIFTQQGSSQNNKATAQPSSRAHVHHQSKHVASSWAATCLGTCTPCCESSSIIISRPVAKVELGECSRPRSCHLTRSNSCSSCSSRRCLNRCLALLSRTKQLNNRRGTGRRSSRASSRWWCCWARLTRSSCCACGPCSSIPLLSSPSSSSSSSRRCWRSTTGRRRIPIQHALDAGQRTGCCCFRRHAPAGICTLAHQPKLQGLTVGAIVHLCTLSRVLLHAAPEIVFSVQLWAACFCA